MSTPTHSLLATVPLALHDDANRLAWSLGYQPEGGNTFSIPLTDGVVEYRAFHQWVAQSFIDLLTYGKAGIYPPLPWADFGLSVEKVAAVMEAIGPEPLWAVPVDGDWSLADRFAAFLVAHPGWSVVEESDG